MDDKINKIKDLLKYFTNVDENTINTDNFYEVSYYENPLNPDLMEYCFNNILDFKVKKRVFEKINYIIKFDYKGTYGCVAHRKLSYIFYIDKDYKDEVLEILSIVKNELEELFLDISKISLNNNNFTMENEYLYYFEKFTFYEERIYKLNKKYNSIKDLSKIECKSVKSKLLQDKEVSYTMEYNKYHNRKRELVNELLYSIESYIDVFYSFLEHILTLLYPFSSKFDLAKSYFELIHNPRWTWDKKLTDIFELDDISTLLGELRKIKEIHRNRNAHGKFSRELKVYAHIDDFGRYPLYVGKQYLKGFTEGYKDIKLDFKLFLKYRNIFYKMFDLLEEKYLYPMIYINNYIDIPVDVSSLMKDINSKEDVEARIDRIDYEINNQLNMDW
ncbi:hypothetical protein SDC9_48644 [bioreactor metagenome]|uniref:Uncharacterized protein n=1 Tax=bioreactor metagenome TaxID=1076179 RepID=A0A644WEX0_9ZZZZ